VLLLAPIPNVAWIRWFHAGALLCIYFFLEVGMKPYPQDFIEFAIEQNVLRFGEFTLKFGRVKSLLFNAGSV